MNKIFDDKWKKKPNKKELYDLINCYTKEIERLQKLLDIEKNKREQFDKDNQKLSSIIKEVREYIASFNLLKNLGALEKEPISISELKHILEILDIGEDDEEN